MITDVTHDIHYTVIFGDRCELLGMMLNFAALFKACIARYVPFTYGRFIIHAYTQIQNMLLYTPHTSGFYPCCRTVNAELYYGTIVFNKDIGILWHFNLVIYCPCV